MKIDWNNYSDPSYFIKEYEVDPSWINDLGTEKYLEYRKRWKAASEDLQTYKFPLCLEVESSYACNFKCPNCPRLAATVPKSGNMSLDIFKKLVKECEKEHLDSIFLDHGGEALLNKNITEFAGLCKNAGITDIMISTNASLLTRDISRELIKNGLTKINFSIDAATEETYSITRAGGVFNKTMENIEMFLEEKQRAGKSYPRVRVSFIIQSANKGELEAFYKNWEKKINVISFQKTLDYNEILDEKDGSIDSKTYNFKCYQPFTNLMVDWKGGVHVCNHDYNHKYILGNLESSSIKECWLSEEMEKFRKIHKEGKWSELNFCKNCVLGSK